MSSRWILGSLMAALMLLMVASVAYAAEVFCSPNNATCTGTEEHDDLNGTDGPDLMYGLGGDDDLFAHRGQDTVYGNTGSDRLFGAVGSDTLRGNKGNDDVIDGYGTNDVDQLFGGLDNDRMRSEDGDNLDTLDCGPGFDKVVTADPGDTIAENCEDLPE